MASNNTNNYFVGECLEEATFFAFSFSGFALKDHKVRDEGVDVVATFDMKEIVCECWNWGRDSYPTQERIWSILTNFNEHPYATWVLITANKVDFGNFQKILQNYGVKVVTLGKQLLSKSRDNFRFVLEKLREAEVLYFNYEISMKKTDNKKKVVNIEAKVPFERIFESSIAVVFCFRTAFSVILNQLKNDTRFVIANFMKFR